jgi:hypothetical protein
MPKTSIVPTELPRPALLPLWLASMLTTWPSIFQIPKLGTKLKEDVLPLSYTPRKLIQHPANRFMYLIEGDHRTWSEELVKQKAAELVRRMVC